jgi:hypothetical protein
MRDRLLTAIIPSFGKRTEFSWSVKNLHPDLQAYWPTTIGSHVYRLVEILVQSLQE